ncbi:hypothetical protein V6N13_040873 [Hibiscus sabdariffa]|uniref:Uncharacterized protein n=1 Tax=Hibiscus sabdariffa TaxID=183260 RepID=A0ABR2RAF3_9ROSI
MENPNAATAFEIATGGLGADGGRPSDNVIALDGMTALEHPRSPSASEVQPSYKKDRCVDGSNEDQGDLDVMMRDDLSDIVEDLNTSVPSIALSPSAKAVTGGNPLPGIPTFKDKLLGSAGVIRDTVPLNDLDVDVREEDIRIGGFS